MPRTGSPTPLRDQITAAISKPFEFGALSTLPLFPVLSREEMRTASGNELADVADQSPGEVWTCTHASARPVREFRGACLKRPTRHQIRGDDLRRTDNAIAAFLIDQFAFHQLAWDRFLAGNNRAMTETQLRGAKNS